LPACARDEDFEDGVHRYREQHAGEIDRMTALTAALDTGNIQHSAGVLI